MVGALREASFQGLGKLGSEKGQEDKWLPTSGEAEIRSGRGALRERTKIVAETKRKKSQGSHSIARRNTEATEC